MNGRPDMQITAPGASPEEVAAITAAVEQFRLDTAPEPVTGAIPAPSAWKRAALAEGVARQPELQL